MRMVVLDMDGTLLRSDKTVSARTLAILQSLRASGTEIIIATARPPRAVADVLPEQLKNSTIVCYNGAEIYHAGELIYRQYISPSDVAAIVTGMGKSAAVSMLAIECEDVFYADTGVDAVFPGLPYTSLASFRLGEQAAAKVLLALSQTVSPKQLRDQLPAGCVMALTDGGTLCQIMHQDVTKVTAISLLAAKRGHTLAEVIAFGDDHNDLEMITHCGVGVAMGNAVPELKQVADIVTLTNDEDGVAHVLEQLANDQLF